MRFLAVIVGAVALALSLIAEAATLTGRVVGVPDGDSITVLDAERQQHKIRLAGIDAPERGRDVTMHFGLKP